MTNNRIVAGVAMLVGCLAVFCAHGADTVAPGNHSAEWNKNLKMAVNDAGKAADAIKAMPAADRATFAAEVLAALQTKSQHMSSKSAWVNEFAATAAALVAGAEGAKMAVISAVAAGIVNACVDAESRELTSGSLAQLGELAKSVMSQLKDEDRLAFAKAQLFAVNQQKTADVAVHKQAMSLVALSLFAGAGSAKDSVLAEVFAVADGDDLGAIAQTFSDAFNRSNNKMDNDKYQQTTLQLLQALAARLKGQADATRRFAYLTAAFVQGAGNPAQFETDLLGRLADLLAGIGATKDGFAAALVAAKADMAENAKHTKNLFVRPLGGLLYGLPFVHENRPPPRRYQNQI